MSRFISGFAVRIDEMLEFRKAHGYKEETYLSCLLKFDRHCAEHFPKDNKLTSVIVCSWIDAETKCGGGLIGNATAIRHLGKYLSALGEEAYILPERVAAHRHSFSPYIFTDAELTALFKAIDNLSPDKSDPNLTEIVPTLFRLIYTCGLRPNEARELLTENVNLETGEILITHTKRNKERIVVMSDDMLKLAQRYDLRHRIFSAGSPFFFPASDGSTFKSDKILAAFNKAWTVAMPAPQNAARHRVRVYDLRHRFASACLNRWLDEGKNLPAMLPYLRAYMGHGTLNETAYYIHVLPENLIKSAAIDWDAFSTIFPATKGAAL